ncbi:MAG: hypothetical protein K9L75_06770 [Spirochaetia bacterium]|nr:hypothetical protein [Spirochaetia bacterium]
MSAKQKKRSIKIKGAVKGRGLVQPRFSQAAWRFMITVGTPYLKFFEGVSSVSIAHPERLTENLEAFHTQKKRLIIAFRHVAKEDAPVMVYGLNKVLPKMMKKLKRRYPYHPHVRFLYGKDVLNWAGKAAVWLFPRIGSIPVVNGGTQNEVLSIIRNEIREGKFPLALAPEGQVTYHMYSCGGTTPGTAAIAYWGLESGQDVTILPVSLGYRYSENPTDFVLSMMERWQRSCGRKIVQQGWNGAETSAKFIFPLLLELTDKTLGILEKFYYLPNREKNWSSESFTYDPERDRDVQKSFFDFPGTEKRIEALCEAALSRAEATAGITQNTQTYGNWFQRLLKIRFTGVDSLYPDNTDPEALHSLDRSIADFRAAEAHIYLRHSQIADVLEYVNPRYVIPPVSAGRASEYMIMLLDLLNRLNGGAIGTRYSPKGKKAVLYVGQPISTTETVQSISDNAVSDENTAGKPLSSAGKRKRQHAVLHKTISDSLETLSKELENYWEQGYFK